MSIRPIDIGIVQQLSDISQIKQHENERPMIEQQSITTQIQKDTQHKSEQVSSKDDAKNENKRYDAKDKSDNEYNGNHGNGQKEKQKEDGKVFLKGQRNVDFDVKI
jgi:hypothetical protein